jgi:hypothetical protein
MYHKVTLKKIEKETSFVNDNNLQVIIVIEVDIEETHIIDIKCVPHVALHFGDYFHPFD